MTHPNTLESVPLVACQTTDTSPSASSADAGPPPNAHLKRTVHAIMLSIVFVVLFPSFALSLHLYPSSKVVSRIHAPLQIFTLLIAVAGMAVGISCALDLGELNGYHTIIGMVAISTLVVFQPVMGLVQHLHYRKHKSKTLFAYAHRWLGRLCIILGIINGGLGFMYAGGLGDPAVPTGAVIAYCLLSGFGLAAYISVLIVPKRRANQVGEEK
jgi:hypothetical protein